MEFAKFHNLHKNKQSPMSITTQSSTCKKKKKHNLSKECTCSIPRTRYSTSGARARATSGDKLVIPMLYAMTSIVSLATILIFFQTQKRTKTFFVSKKLPHLTETKPATVYSWILVERTGKNSTSAAARLAVSKPRGSFRRAAARTGFSGDGRVASPAFKISKARPSGSELSWPSH